MVRPVANSLLLFFGAFVLLACSGSAADSALTAQENLGQRIFGQYCASCHFTSGDAVTVGPSLASIAIEAGGRIAGIDARSYLDQSILLPSAYLNPGYNDLMPQTFSQILSTDDLDAVISYLLTLD